MVNRVLIIFFFLVFSESCCKKHFHELSMQRTLYLGDEIRIDGYYYSETNNKNDRYLIVFYRNGVCLQVLSSIEDSDTLKDLEDKILKNQNLLDRFWNTPTNIGVFNIKNNEIESEIWMAGRNITTFTFSGEVINDSTIYIRDMRNNAQGKTWNHNLTYYFKSYSPKPDSTNAFIK